MTLSEISIRHRVFAWMLMSALIVFGGISFVRMGVSQLPDVDFPVVTAQLSLIGAAPEIMETQVVDPVEDAVMSVEGVRNVKSVSYEGASTVTVEFELGRDIDSALRDVETRISQAQRLLPKNMDPVVVTKTNPEDQPILWLAASSDSLPLRDLTIYVRDQLKDRFTSIPGVGDIILGGYIEPNMRIWMSSEKLHQFYLSATDVIAAIQNEHSEPPSGYVTRGRYESNIRMLGEAKTPKDFEDIIINSRGGAPNYRPIRLKQVAKVEAGMADLRRISRTMGKPAVGLGIRKQRGANAVAVATAVKARLNEVKASLPKEIELAV
ncbi:MAG TPA: AcrB/AcrD/AcrF family protein, partial [Bdellovibrionales bacterium]|nr:AcrB/AcrD/AcrF family protein [Bdellovibrionales bacterium]